MATAERPPAKIDGKPNPAYQAWYRAQKKAAKRLQTPLDAFIQGSSKQAAGPLTDVMLDAIKDMMGPPGQIEILIRAEDKPTLLAKLAALENPETIMLRVVKLARNSRFVLCEHPTEKGKTLGVKLLPRQLAAKLLKKSIRVQMTEGKAIQVR